MGFNTKKSLGQNFLNNSSVIDEIVNSFDIEKNSVIVEIGPGEGALTRELVKKGVDVIAFEIDKRLEGVLSEIDALNLKIVYEDVLSVDLGKYVDGYDNVYVIANLPYYITTPIVKKLIDENINVSKMALMVQKEVGERFYSKPGSRSYGSLSVYLQYYFRVFKLLDVDRENFSPVPNVDSVVVGFERFFRDVNDELFFFKLVRDSFVQKRKNIRNNLKSYDLVKLEEVLFKLGKNLRSRAEEISVEEFIEISNYLC